MAAVEVEKENYFIIHGVLWMRLAERVNGHNT